jgi:hypothetical protein
MSPPCQKSLQCRLAKKLFERSIWDFADGKHGQLPNTPAADMSAAGLPAATVAGIAVQHEDGQRLAPAGVEEQLRSPSFDLAEPAARQAGVRKMGNDRSERNPPFE